MKILVDRKVTHRDMRVYESAVKSVEHLALVPEVKYALDAWVKAFKGKVPGILIGGLALGLYVRPRTTTDVDLLFLEESDIPDEAPGFKRIRNGAFQNNKDHVELEVITPERVKVSKELFRKVIETSVKHSNGLRVASLEGLVCLKVSAALNTPKRARQDLADAFALLTAKTTADFSMFLDHLTIEEKAKITELQKEVKE